MAPRVLRIPFAIRPDGTPVHVDDFEGTGFRPDCLCPECRQPLVAKKGDHVVHHFAHDGEHSCTGETILHLIAKQLLKQRIEVALAAGAPLLMQWQCARCGNQHTGNLLKRGKAVALEQRVDVKVPDLQLLNEYNEVCAVIEVVVSHAPEESARATYAARKIPIVEFHVATSMDLVALRDQRELQPAAVSFCPVPEHQLRYVNLGKLRVRLDRVMMEVNGSTLTVLDREQRGVGECALDGRFHFDDAETAKLALSALSGGAIDGLNDREWMEQNCINRFMHHDLFRKVTYGLREYRMEWKGFGTSRWQRDKWRRSKDAELYKRRNY